MNMPTEKRTLLTIITEAVVEPTLLRELDRFGVRGYTVSDARGKGSRGGVRDAAWEEAANIRSSFSEETISQKWLDELSEIRK